MAAIVHQNYDSVLVTANVKNNTIVLENARVAEIGFQLMRCIPFGRCTKVVPLRHLLLRVPILRAAFPESTQSEFRDNPHRHTISFSRHGSKCNTPTMGETRVDREQDTGTKG